MLKIDKIDKLSHLTFGLKTFLKFYPWKNCACKTYNSLPIFLISMGALIVISHTWDLGQQASKNFTKIFYKGIINTKKVNIAFQQSLKNMHQHNVMEYGGYTLLGNGNLVFE
jgi:hypothetical protein